LTGKHLTADTRITTRETAARLYIAGSTIQSVAHQIGFSYGLTRTLLIERKPGGLRVSSFQKETD
jgi:hypothetical protein